MADEFPPELLGEFAEPHLLGRGGMGVVYRAVQRELSRPVAVKVLSADTSSDPQYLARFLNEARLAARIRHPNVIVVLSSAITRRSEGYIVYELLEGESLQALLDRCGKLPWTQAVAIAGGVLAGLTAIHDAGIFHRDLKPDNIFLLPGGVPKILDFGVAREVGRNRVQTAAGIVLGTPHYIAPELILGSPPGAASDLYSLGVVVFRMLTGRLPFEAGTLPELLTAHVRSAPPDPRSLEPELPPALGRLVVEALAKDPAARPPTAAAFARRLEEVPRAGEDEATKVVPVRPRGRVHAPSRSAAVTRPLSAALPAREPPRRARWPVVAVGLALLAAGLAIGNARRPRLAAPSAEASAADRRPAALAELEAYARKLPDRRAADSVRPRLDGLSRALDAWMEVDGGAVALAVAALLLAEARLAAPTLGPAATPYSERAAQALARLHVALHDPEAAPRWEGDRDGRALAALALLERHVPGTLERGTSPVAIVRRVATALGVARELRPEPAATAQAETALRAWVREREPIAPDVPAAWFLKEDVVQGESNPQAALSSESPARVPSPVFLRWAASLLERECASPQTPGALDEVLDYLRESRIALAHIEGPDESVHAVYNPPDMLDWAGYLDLEGHLSSPVLDALHRLHSTRRTARGREELLVALGVNDLALELSRLRAAARRPAGSRDAFDLSLYEGNAPDQITRRFAFFNLLKRRVDLEMLAGPDYVEALHTDAQRLRRLVNAMRKSFVVGDFKLYSALYNALPETLLAVDDPAR